MPINVQMMQKFMKDAKGGKLLILEKAFAVDPQERMNLSILVEAGLMTLYMNDAYRAHLTLVGEQLIEEADTKESEERLERFFEHFTQQNDTKGAVRYALGQTD